MFDQPIKNLMERKKFLTAPPHTTVSAAAKLMAAKNVGAILVVKDEGLAGIFSERDAVFRVIAKGLNPGTTPLSQVMTASPKTLEPGKTYGHALLLMQENGFRHVPVVENGKPIGIISSRNAMDPDLEEFVFEERRREHHR
jgi:CBS domain-containing protein